MSKWNAEEEHLVCLLLPTNSLREITEELARRHDQELPGFRIKRTLKAVERKCERESWTAESCKSYVAPHADRWAEILKASKEHRYSYDEITTGLTESRDRKILSISDLHLPFTRVELVEQVLELHSDADIVVINGDFLDGYMFSTFTKSKKMGVLVEYQMAFKMLQYIAENFPKVVLVLGNHDVRPAKALGRAGFSNEESQLFRPDLLARLANGEELDDYGNLKAKHDFSNVIYQPNESWYVRIGKTIFCHPHGWAGSGPGENLVKLDKIFRERYQDTEYDSMVIGHTHKLFWGVYNNRLLIEQGAFAARAGYENKPDMRASHSMCGYAVVYQDLEGNTNFNDSRPWYLGSEQIQKKDLLKL